MSLNASRFGGLRPDRPHQDYDDGRRPSAAVDLVLTPTEGRETFVAGEGPCALAILAQSWSLLCESAPSTDVLARFGSRGKSDVEVVVEAFELPPGVSDVILCCGTGDRASDVVATLNDRGRFAEAWSFLAAALDAAGPALRVPLPEYDLPYAPAPSPPALGLGDRIAGLLAGLRAVEALRAIRDPQSNPEELRCLTLS